MSHTFIRTFNNRNRPILAGDKPVERTHFNLVRLTPGETYRYRLSEFESVVVPLTGTCDLTVNGESFLNLGHRTTVWDGKADAVYAGPNADVAIVAQSDCEIAIAGGWWDRQMAPFRIRPEEVEMVDVGSHETKSRRRIFHILGQNGAGRAGNLLVSELYADEGCWSGYPPHKHDTDRPPEETRHNEIYNFRFRPENGFGLQLLQRDGMAVGQAFHVLNASTLKIGAGYHPCVAAPGHEMYYFTIIAGQSQRSLRQFFQPTYAYQIETIPGIKDMIAKFR